MKSDFMRTDSEIDLPLQYLLWRESMVVVLVVCKWGSFGTWSFCLPERLFVISTLTASTASNGSLEQRQSTIDNRQSKIHLATPA